MDYRIGRGELHLSILIETMRREGYELQVSRPERLSSRKLTVCNVEPFERVQIRHSEEYRLAIQKSFWAQNVRHGGYRKRTNTSDFPCACVIDWVLN